MVHVVAKGLSQEIHEEEPGHQTSRALEVEQ